MPLTTQDAITWLATTAPTEQNKGVEDLKKKISESKKNLVNKIKSYKSGKVDATDGNIDGTFADIQTWLTNEYLEDLKKKRSELNLLANKVKEYKETDGDLNKDMAVAVLNQPEANEIQTWLIPNILENLKTRRDEHNKLEAETAKIVFETNWDEVDGEGLGKILQDIRHAFWGIGDKPRNPLQNTWTFANTINANLVELLREVEEYRSRQNTRWGWVFPNELNPTATV